jgi:hypothetical protein
MHYNVFQEYHICFSGADTKCDEISKTINSVASVFYHSCVVKVKVYLLHKSLQNYTSKPVYAPTYINLETLPQYVVLLPVVCV